MRLQILIDSKPNSGVSEHCVDMDRLAANEFKLEQRVEEPHEVLTLFTQLMYGYTPYLHYFDTK